MRLPPGARGRFRKRLGATLRFADRDHRYQVREQERDVLGVGPDGHAGAFLRNGLAEAEIILAAKLTGSVIQVPSRRDRMLMGLGTYTGADGLNPYLLAALAGRHANPSDRVWEVAYVATPAGAFVGPVLGFMGMAVMPPRATSRGGLEEPVPLWLPDGHHLGWPGLVVVHLPLVADLWSVMCHVAAGDLDLVIGRDDDHRFHPELAPDLRHYLIGLTYRLAGIQRQLQWLEHRVARVPGGVHIAVSVPAWDGVPEFTRRVGDDPEFGWEHLESLRVYESSPPDRANSGDALRHQVGPRHPGDGSPLPPRVVHIWRAS